ncbi:STAS domain-containing protein [Actinoplanes aureus]|uniref:STAS domain-containing protein n=1 Tax=Actinoplanes aureus TaxID=2792083 RepID=A0A931CJE4_9ACTN|nr:STAS domain-containing protein [Actinoplanes aureus]MBG0568206.1 STAS domain-containing protein [Actinoplanes aureus]
MTLFSDNGSRLYVTVHGEGNRTTVILTGELDMSNEAPLAQLLDTAMGGDTKHLDVQMAELWFVDVAGVRLLLRAHQLGADRGVEVKACDPLPHIVWLLHIIDDAAVLLGVNAPGDMTPYPDGPPPAPRVDEPVDEDSPVPMADAREERDRRADERDRRADEREEQADDRDRLAQERDRLVDERQHRASEHQRWEDIREELADVRERALERREKDL